MSDPVGDEQVQVETPVETQGQPTDQEQAASDGGENAFGYQSILNDLDEFSQEKVRDKLKEMDLAATKRIESVNKNYEPWKQFADAGYQPDQLVNAVGIITELNQNPAEFYRKLQDYLKQEGKLPTAENVQEAAVAVAAESAGETPDDPRIAALQQKLEEIDRRDVEARAQAQRNLDMAAVEQQVQTDIAAVKEKYPGFSDLDMQNVYRIADVQNRAIAESGRQGVYTLPQAAEAWAAERQQILSTPRPGQSAPKLTPVGGNSPVDTQTRKASEVPEKEWAKQMADLLESNRGD